MHILTAITALLGVALGSASLALGICNYLRDRPKIKVHLQWGMEILDNSLPKAERDCGLVRVTNEGRRPAYISHVCLVLPKPYKNRVLLMMESVQGQKLSEGDPPATFIVPHDVPEKYSKDLRKIRARVSDSTGRVYFSKCQRFSKLVSLAKPTNLPT